MILKARHLRNLRHHLPRLAHYVRGRRLFGQHTACFGSKPRVAVVGAGSGGLDKWRPWAMMRMVEGVGFEPEPVECAKMQKLLPFAKFYQIALGNKTGPARFYVTNSNQCSSCLEPDETTLKPFSAAEFFRVRRTSEVQLSRFDDLCDRGELRAPHFLQVDVQGFEYAVLDGFGKRLNEVLAIELETHFIRLYKGEKILFELIQILKQRGFVLRHLEPQGLFGGELVEANAFFVRLLSSTDTEKQSLVRLWDFVYELPHFPETREGLVQG